MSLRGEARACPSSTRKPRTRAVELGPHERDVGDRAVRDPALGAVEHVAAAGARVARGEHAGRVRAEVGLGEAEAADRSPVRHRAAASAPSAPRSRTRRSDTSRASPAPSAKRADARVAALELLADRGRRRPGSMPGAAVAVERRAEQAQLAELAGRAPAGTCRRGSAGRCVGMTCSSTNARTVSRTMRSSSVRSSSMA